MKCTYINEAGKSCNANAVRGHGLCFSHDPELRDRKIAAVTNGGLNRRHYQVYGQPMTLKTPDDVKGLLNEVINKVWTGEMPSNQPANTIGFLARCFLDAHEAGDVERKLEKLEQLAEKMGV